MSISTKGLKKSFISKELKPGNVVAKINSIRIQTVEKPKDAKVPEYKIWMDLESKPIGGDFVGFDKVFGDPSKGQYLGQTKSVQFSNWPIKTRTGTSKKTGKPYEILDSSIILEFLQKLLTEAGNESWLEENDGKFNTWNELFTGINRSGILKDKYFSWCLAATESVNAQNYPIYYMYLPESNVSKNPFAKEGGLVSTFDASIHITKNKKAENQENIALNAGVDDDSDDDLDFTPPSDDDQAFLDDAELFDLED